MTRAPSAKAIKARVERERAAREQALCKKHDLSLYLLVVHVAVFGVCTCARQAPCMHCRASAYRRDHNAETEAFIAQSKALREAVRA